jgi:hypothetical protein
MKATIPLTLLMILVLVTILSINISAEDLNDNISLNVDIKTPIGELNIDNPDLENNLIEPISFFVIALGIVAIILAIAKLVKNSKSK